MAHEHCTYLETAGYRNNSSTVYSTGVLLILSEIYCTVGPWGVGLKYIQFNSFNSRVKPFQCMEFHTFVFFFFFFSGNGGETDHAYRSLLL